MGEVLGGTVGGAERPFELVGGDALFAAARLRSPPSFVYGYADATVCHGTCVPESEGSPNSGCQLASLNEAERTVIGPVWTRTRWTRPRPSSYKIFAKELNSRTA